METIRYFRQLRRRWKLILAVTLVGLAFGAVAANRVADRSTADVVEVVYYDVKHTLIVNEANPSGVNLPQAAFFATIGQVPQNVADRLGGDPTELAASIQTLTNSSLRTIVLSAVQDTPQNATDVTNAFAEELTLLLLADDIRIYDEAVSASAAAVTTAAADLDAADVSIASVRDDLDALESQIDALQNPVAELDDNGDPITVELEQSEIDAIAEQLDELDDERNTTGVQLTDLERQRTALQSRLQVAIVDEDETLAQGEPVPTMLTLDVSAPAEVAERERDRRLAAGREGTANYDNLEDLPTGGRRGISSSLLDSPKALLLAGLIGGFFGGLAMALAWARLDHRILDKDDAEEYFGLPVIAEIPKLRKEFRKKPIIVSHAEPMSHIAEAYRSLRSALMYVRDFGENNDDASDNDGPKSGTVILITSPGASEGKTSTVANLATVLSEEGYSVLTVNCDFRRPRLAFFMGGEHEPRRLSATDVNGVSLINHVTSDGAEAHPSDVLREQKRVITSARSRFDVILLDTAPMLATNDAAEVLPLCDLVLVVSQVGRTTKESAEATKEILERRQAPVAGVVLIGSDGVASAPGYYYYYNDRKGAKWRFANLRSRRRRDEKHLQDQQERIAESEDSSTLTTTEI